LTRLITPNESIIIYQKERKTRSGENPDSAPKKAEVVPCADKILSLVFWDSRRIIMIDYLPRGQTITRKHNGDLEFNVTDKFANREHNNEEEGLNSPRPHTHA
jgi:hypothetical protein